MKDFKFHLDQWGVQEVIYASNAHLTNLEKEQMEKALGRIQAAFVQDFGTTGSFDLQFIRQKIGGKGARYVNGIRPVYRAVATDAKTRTILKRHNLKHNENWLGKFGNQLKF